MEGPLPEETMEQLDSAKERSPRSAGGDIREYRWPEGGVQELMLKGFLWHFNGQGAVGTCLLGS